MTRRDVVERLLEGRSREPGRPERVFAPANIALCKYWGKRAPELNLPLTGSLSVSLGTLGAYTQISLAENDVMIVNGAPIASGTRMFDRAFAFLDLFRSPGTSFALESESTIPIGAGLASSASGFAAMVVALDRLFDWQLPGESLSVLARLGSGSACRSVYPGFVEWDAGEREDGLDCFARRLDCDWNALRLGLVTVSDAEKPIGSTEAMNRTVADSASYRQWPEQVARDLPEIRDAVLQGDFKRLGEAAERNALAMHATMWDCSPPIRYQLPETYTVMDRVKALRADGLSLYLTMDAGPNVKLLFQAAEQSAVEEQFPGVQVVNPFN